MKRHVLHGLLLALLVLLVPGCALFNSVDLEYHRTTTIGQELIDLKEALDRGAITATEFEILKEEIKRGGPAPNFKPDDDD
jgi:hypothetical protein